MLDGVVALLTDSGEQLLGAGMPAEFLGGKADGHHLINHSSDTAKYLAIGSRIPNEEVHYPYIDLHLVRNVAGSYQIRNKGGEPC